MKRSIKFWLVFGSFVVGSLTTSAAIADRPGGIRIGQRMTLRPYVSISATYDSNVGGSHDGNLSDNGDGMWTVNPGLGLEYSAENWSLLLSAYYNYHAYFKKENRDSHNQHTYGETLRWNWSNSKGGEQGWALMLSESYSKVAMSDDLSYSDGRSYTADREQFSINGSVQRRFNEQWHSEFNAGYYLLNYNNDTSWYNDSALYGWQRWSAGLSGGFAASKWTDIIADIGYTGYTQDNVDYQGLSGNSQGYRAQMGLGSYATERISYRALAGWSRFEYANGASSDDGFVYTVSGSWKISDTLNTMLLATSYYQPSERELSSQSRVDSLSWGIAKSLIRSKLNATFDLTYRRETHEGVSSYWSTRYTDDYALDVVTGRIGVNYTLNRFLSLFSYAEYMRSFNDNSDNQSGYGDYDRWRVTAGVRLTY